jgi:hypothetical protein
LVNSTDQKAVDQLGYEVLKWVRNRIDEPKQKFDVDAVRVARIIYTRNGDFTYYERVEDEQHFLPEDYSWRWSAKAGKALEGYRHGERWFSWYPQGRINTRNQNQLHFHGENRLIPPFESSSRYDFSLGVPARIALDTVIDLIAPLL